MAIESIPWLDTSLKSPKTLNVILFLLLTEYKNKVAKLHSVSNKDPKE